MNARSSHGAPTLACGQSMSQTRCWWSGSIMTLSARRSPCTRESPGAHPQRLLLPADQLLARCRSAHRPMSPASVGVLAPGLVVERVQLAPAGEVVGQQVVRARQRVAGQRLGVCERSHARRRRRAGRPGFHGSSGERPCTTSKPRITQSPSSEDHRSRGAGTCGGRARGRPGSRRGRGRGDGVLLAGDGLDEDAAPVGELEHGREAGAEPAGRADLGRDLGSPPARRSGPGRAGGGRASPAAGR